MKKKRENANKVSGLIKKWSQQRVREPDIRGVLYRDDDLDVEAEDKLDVEEVTVYGGVEVSNEKREVLKMNLKMKLFDKIDEINLEVEIEKGLTKARYQLMNSNVANDDDDEDDDNQEDVDDNEALDLSNKRLDYSKPYSDLQTCRPIRG